MARWRAVFAVAVCCAYPLLNHAAAVLDEPRWAAVGVALVAGVLASAWLRAGVAIVLAAAVFGLSVWIAGRFPGLLLYSPPVVVNLVLCGFFARTLLAPRDPLITGFARVSRGGHLPPDLARYTRNLTAAWAVFFASMAAISVTLAVTGPIATWSFFTNLLNYLLVVLFFVLEYVYRRIRYRHHPHASPWQMISRLREFKIVTRPQ
jgi:uncharacterized membrane protein